LFRKIQRQLIDWFWLYNKAIRVVPFIGVVFIIHAYYPNDDAIRLSLISLPISIFIDFIVLVILDLRHIGIVKSSVGQEHIDDLEELRIALLCEHFKLRNPTSIEIHRKSYNRILAYGAYWEVIVNYPWLWIRLNYNKEKAKNEIRMYRLQHL